MLVIKFVLEEHMLWGGCTKSFSVFLIVCLLAVCLPILLPASLVENMFLVYRIVLCLLCRSQWPRGLRRSSAAARLLRLWVQIPLGHGCLSVVGVVCCQVEVSATSYHSSRGVLLTVVHYCVWSRNLVNEEAMAHWELLHQKKKFIVM